MLRNFTILWILRRWNVILCLVGSQTHNGWNIGDPAEGIIFFHGRVPLHLQKQAGNGSSLKNNTLIVAYAFIVLKQFHLM